MADFCIYCGKRLKDPYIRICPECYQKRLEAGGKGE